MSDDYCHLSGKVPTNDTTDTRDSITVSCENHHNKLIDGLWDAFLNRRLVDFVLKENDERGNVYRAHHVVLDAFLSSEKLSASSSHEYASLLEFMYRGRVTVKKDRLSKLLEVARETEFQILVEALESADTKDQQLNSKRSPSTIDDDGDLKYQSRPSCDSGNRPLVEETPTTIDVQTPPEFVETDPVKSKPFRPRRKAGTPVKFIVFKTREKKVLPVVEKEEEEEEEEKEEEEEEAEPEMEAAVAPDADESDSDYDPAVDSDTSKRESTSSTVKKSRGKGPHRCTICAKLFQHLCHLKRHKETHDRDEQYKCELCGKGFKWLKSLDAHMCPQKAAAKSSAVQPSERPDSQQSGIINETPQKRGHVRRQRKEPYRCDVCSKEFWTLKNLRQHDVNHLPSRNGRFECGLCEQKFVYQNALEAHVLTHTGKKGYKCDVCGKEFHYQRHLKRHGIVHGEDRPYMCHICSKTFLRSGDLHCHTASVHATEKRFQCDQCGRAFALRRNLSAHLMSHAGVRPFKCNLCDKAFSVRRNLAAHIRAHTGQKPFECPLCSRKFTSRIAVEDHKRLHTGERPFQCDGCGRAFVGKRFLRRHLRLGCSGGAVYQPDVRIQRVREKKAVVEASPSPPASSIVVSEESAN